MCDKYLASVEYRRGVVPFSFFPAVKRKISPFAFIERATRSEKGVAIARKIGAEISIARDVCLHIGGLAGEKFLSYFLCLRRKDEELSFPLLLLRPTT